MRNACARRAGITLLATILVSVLALIFTVQNRKSNSNKESLVSETASFRQRNAVFDAAFPWFSNSLLINIDGPSTLEEQVSEFAEAEPALTAISKDGHEDLSGLLFLPTKQLGH